MRRAQAIRGARIGLATAVVLALLAGCEQGATTDNGITRGPALPSGFTSPPVPTYGPAGEK